MVPTRSLEELHKEAQELFAEAEKNGWAITEIRISPEGRMYGTVSFKATKIVKVK